MYCTNCGSKLEGKFCTKCGMKAEVENVIPEESQVIQEQSEQMSEPATEQTSVNENTIQPEPQIEQDQQEQEQKSDIFSALTGSLIFLIIAIVLTVLLIKVNMSITLIVCFWLSAIAQFVLDKKFESKLLSSVVGFVSGLLAVILLFKLGVNIFLLIACFAALGLCSFLEKTKSSLFKPVEIISSVLAIALLFSIYNGYKGQKCIAITQECNYAVNASYEDMFNKVSDELKWKCVDRGVFTVLGKGSYDAVVTVKGNLFKWSKDVGEYVDPSAYYVVEFNIIEDNKYAEPVKLTVCSSSDENIYTESSDIEDFLDFLYNYYFWNNLLSD